MEIKSRSAGGRKNISDHESQAGAMDLDAIVERACQGDTEALAEIYRRFSPRVLGLCRHMLGSNEAAEDAMSEVFLRVQRATASYNGSVPFLSWLYSIASHHCVDLLRRRQVERRFVVEEDSELELMSKSTLSPIHE